MRKEIEKAVQKYGEIISTHKSHYGYFIVVVDAGSDYFLIGVDQLNNWSTKVLNIGRQANIEELAIQYPIYEGELPQVRTVTSEYVAEDDGPNTPQTTPAKEGIFNLTQHEATPDQIRSDVVEPNWKVKDMIKCLLTFDSIPSGEEMEEKSEKLAEIASQYKTAMIGGAPFFMSFLEKALIRNGITPCYAFTKRITDEKDGVKKSVFKHEGFIIVKPSSIS